MYSIPLRRALVTQSDLPYRKAVACAEVLKVGGGTDAEADAVEHARAGLLAVVWGSIVSGAFALVVATRIFRQRHGFLFPPWHARRSDRIRLAVFVRTVRHRSPDRVMGRTRVVGWGTHRLALGRAPLFIAWCQRRRPGGCLHMTSGITRSASSASGTIMVAALWTLAKLVKPVYGGLLATLAASRAARRAGNPDIVPSTDRDIPIGVIGLLMVVCLAPIAVLLANFDSGGVLQGHMTTLVIVG